MIPAFQQALQSELYAIASRSLTRAQAAAHQYKIPVAYGNYEACIADAQIDALYIPLPNAFHARWTLQAAQAGKHILCEKPLATSAADAVKMIDACRVAGVQLMEVFTWRFHPQWKQLQQVIAQLGEIRHVRASFTCPNTLSADKINMREDNGGALFDLGCYVISAIQEIFGCSPVRVSATAELYQGINAQTTGWLDFGKGNALFHCGYQLPYRVDLEVVGSLGTLWAENLFFPDNTATYKVHLNNCSPQIFLAECANQTVAMIEAFTYRLLKHTAFEYPTEAPSVLQTLSALNISSLKHCVVEL
jgi:predicted dehydrogenase